MRIIAHRANLIGPNPKTENRINQICTAIQSGFDVEIDVRLVEDKYYLGHDTTQEEIPLSFLNDISKFAWVHAKDLETFLSLLFFPDINVFCHNEDPATLTNKGFVWLHHLHYNQKLNKYLANRSVLLRFNYESGFVQNNFYAICTDYPIKYWEELNKF